MASRRRRGGSSRRSLIGTLAWRNRPLANPAIADSSAITAEQLEQQYGVRLDVVGLLASGGLLELKFQVHDADKASALFGPAEDMPVLAVEGSTRVLKSASGMKHHFEILDGASYFFLYTNVANAVHEGSEVAFVHQRRTAPAPRGAAVANDAE